MICPYCGTHIDDASLICPACHAELQKTVMMPRLEATYCKSCGALVPKGQVRCPSCGLPVEDSLQKASGHVGQGASRALSPEEAALSTLAPQAALSAHAEKPVAPSESVDALQVSADVIPSGRHFKIQLPSPEDDPLTTAQFEAQNGLAFNTAEKNLDVQIHLQSKGQSQAQPQAQPADFQADGVLAAEPGSSAEDETTSSIPRIESAIPSLATSGYSNERLPHLRAVIFTAAVALVVVGGSALMIAHPWDPGAFQSHNTQAFDTSKAGFPGEVAKLKGQDSTTTAATVVSGDQASYEQLKGYYDDLTSIYDTLVAEDAAFEETAFGSQGNDLQKHADTVKATTYKISNLISSINGVDTTSGTYTTTKQNLITLGNWLRNWCEPLNESYQAALASPNRQADKSEISRALKAVKDSSGKNTYQHYFEDNVKSWEPQAPKS